MPAMGWAHSAPSLRSWIQADLQLWGSSSSSQSCTLLMSKPLKTVHEKGLVHLLSPFLPYFALFLILSYTGCFHHRWLFPTLLLPIWSGILHSFAFPLKTIALHLKTFMLLALTNIHQRFLDLSCSSGILSVAMVGSSPRRPIKAPVWKSVTWDGFY